ncbi:3-hydroxyacyl-CoA dehydrogenase NAD-binding domain-containing protein [Epilithonimonas ginsengisoli]|uniref:3-hydroxyacyl-CoA dehydrogenase NAD-binding domain-containing protein n=1 Tax=Epilithonimonas ginsengisoli TaxID=1245592 RepID=A0ABU4JM91_9FLAO|nr:MULTISPECIES: 3-hydroxyacyl-CoA dehydrogenase NAD-binding domain-containing protein [Chryseobacterium group]MBV6881811.1 3-hydroxybutyryl-CoA dehydrogenase [Epilithonimonas sp. FP105]MDW8550821.1 3-hydroxyacyl-CoA dehydrogenase NAD-binding domain-containing protein [Epilithonimonas ginsengisoli]OAH70448.1 3-hydroxybutyryl-CoA dehydrogenase [Chryseobacterium sp. FP211-J200]
MKIGIVGSGAMGSGIAQVLATAENEVLLYDSNPLAVEKAGKDLEAQFQKLAEKGKMTFQESETYFDKIRLSDKMSELKDSELIIEAIVEDLEIKKDLFQKLEILVSKDCILATNTSSLSIASIASACQKPERVIGIHFFNPAPLMALVEVIPAVQTDKELIFKVKNLVESWKKLPVIAKDTPGFIVNRVARPFYGEAIRILEEGIADCATIDFAMTSLGGFKMGPFQLMDFIGHDVNYRVTESVFKEFFYDPKFKPSFTQKRLFEAGYYGRKSGKGFYDYSQNAEQPKPNDNPELLELIFKRILVMLMNEASDAYFLNIASAEDIDLAMTKGVNYPKGLLKWADEFGLEKLQNELDELYQFYHEDRYRCSPIIRNLVKQNKNFY